MQLEGTNIHDVKWIEELSIEKRLVVQKMKNTEEDVTQEIKDEMRMNSVTERDILFYEETFLATQKYIPRVKLKQKYAICSCQFGMNNLK